MLRFNRLVLARWSDSRNRIHITKSHWLSPTRPRWNLVSELKKKNPAPRPTHQNKLCTPRQKTTQHTSIRDHAVTFLSSHNPPQKPARCQHTPAPSVPLHINTYNRRTSPYPPLPYILRMQNMVRAKLPSPSNIELSIQHPSLILNPSQLPIFLFFFFF